MEKIRIKFKQTIGEGKCDKCKTYLKGEEGFIKIKRKVWNIDNEILICMNCWNKILEEIEEKKKTKKEDYKLHLKRQMLRRLKK